MKIIIKWIGLIFGLSLCVTAIAIALWIRQYQALSDDEPEIIPTPGISEITYCTMEGNPLTMDLYLPEHITTMPTRVLVYVHGGSFTSGDKRKGSGMVDISQMVERGFAVAAINYRLMPANPFPAAVEDAKCAIRYLRAHQAEYNLDTNKLGIWGGSAGGHLAAMVGLTNNQERYETGEYLEQSSEVQAVVEMFGPTDLTLPMEWLQQILLYRAFNTTDHNSEILHKASPVNYISGDEPPFFIIHGEQDSAVPVEQAEIFHEKLKDTGVSTRLLIVKNANHNFKPTGGAIEPDRLEISSLVADFFSEHLR